MMLTVIWQYMDMLVPPQKKVYGLKRSWSSLNFLERPIDPYIAN